MNFKIDNENGLSFYFSSKTLSGVRRVMDKVAEDVNKVFGITPDFSEVENFTDVNTNDSNSIYVGTLDALRFRSSSKETAGTSMMISMRSSIGPETRLT